MKKIAELEKLATEMVGDGGSPDLFFVSHGGAIVDIMRNFDVAYGYWSSYLSHLNEESAIENRRFGVIASKEPDEVTGKLRVIDDSRMFRKGK